MFLIPLISRADDKKRVIAIKDSALIYKTYILLNANDSRMQFFNLDLQ